MTLSRSSQPSFSASDIRALVRGPTEDERAAAAYRLCRRIDGRLSDADRAAAKEILRVMAQDAAELVRRALSVTLRASDILPRDVALKLVDDVASIATPILTFSPVFSDEDLADIVRRTDALRQVAVAKRATLSETVTDALSAHGVAEAVAIASANDRAKFSESGFNTCLKRFPEHADVTSAIAFRHDLPPAIAETLVTLVSKDVQRHLAATYKLTKSQAAQVAGETRERATVDIIDLIANADDIPKFVRHLESRHRLTPSLLVRAATCGQITFLEHALAALAAVPHHRAWLLIHDAGGAGFRALYERSGLPDQLFTAFRLALDTFHEIARDGRTYDPKAFQSKMLERALTQALIAPFEDIDYLIRRLTAVQDNGRPREMKAARAG
jgi:uncharacterized protein (DUF2336 family)